MLFVQLPIVQVHASQLFSSVYPFFRYPLFRYMSLSCACIPTVQVPIVQVQASPLFTYVYPLFSYPPFRYLYAHLSGTCKPSSQAHVSSLFRFT